MTENSQSIYYPLPQPNEIPEREREDAMGSYLMMFAAVAVALPLPIINLVAAIVYYMVNRRKGRFIHFHTLQSLLSQIPTTLLNWGLLIWAAQIWFFDHLETTNYFWGYLITVGLANLLYFIFSLLAAYYARKGQMYYFIFFGKFSYHQVFSRTKSFKYEGEDDITIENQPPKM